MREKKDLFQTPDLGRKQFLMAIESIALEYSSKGACHLVEEAVHRSFERLCESDSIEQGGIKKVLFSEATKGLLDYTYFSKAQEGVCAGQGWNSDQFEQFKIECIQAVGPQIANLLEQSTQSHDGKPSRHPRKPRTVERPQPLDIHASLEIEGLHGY